MHFLGLGLLVLGILLQTPVSTHAGVYKWIGDNGTVVFSDTPPFEGKPATVVDVEPVAAGMSRPSAGTGSEDIRVAAPVEKKPEKRAEAGNRSTKSKDFPTVELYVTSWCGYCKQAKRFLTSQGVPFKEYDIESDAEAARKMKRLNARGGVPFAVIGDKTMTGFSQAAYQHALGLD